MLVFNPKFSMQVDKDMIQRYHQGKCTPAEQILVEEWLISDETDTSYPADFPLDTAEDKGWRKLSTRNQFSQTAGNNPPVLRDKISSWRLGAWRVAAGIILIAAFSLLIYSLNDRGYFSAKDGTVKLSRVASPRGQKMQVTLSDGSKVYLNAESSLTYPERFANSTRLVELRGEAYFDVARDDDQPFIVYTDRGQVRVLGTRFNLRDYPEDKNTMLVVEEGKVNYSAVSGRDNLILTAGQMATLDNNGKLSAGSGYAADYLAWKSNQLILDNLTLADASMVIGRWYDVKVEVSSRLKNQRYTGSFDNPALTEVLKSMSYAVKFNYKLEGKDLKIF